jgi:F-type H+-transporting ATPase subunit gamma
MVKRYTQGGLGLTRRRELEEHRHKLGEIRDIMSSMKTLAYMETRKLSRFLDNQQQIVKDIEAMAADFISFFPETLPASEERIKETTDVYLLIGSERGFCGNFNETLVPAMESCIKEGTNNKSILIAIGHKLHIVLENDSRVITFIEGANVVEEIESVLMHVADALVSLQATHPTLSLYVLYHGESHGNVRPDDEQQILMQKLLPPFQHYLDKEPTHPHKPVLNVTPEKFLLELIDHYLLASLHEILFTSLMAENHRRVLHLEGAVQRMDDKNNELISKCNALRQEEIIEEIEVILLSTTGLDVDQNKRSSIGD